MTTLAELTKTMIDAGLYFTFALIFYLLGFYEGSKVKGDYED